MLIFPDGENTGNLPKNNNLIVFLHRKFVFNIWKILKTKKFNRVIMGCFYNILSCVVNFEW